ncbi:MAG: PucR family transcriptional regulator ligand-binding domain-containing protein [Vallitaleaceae bacterium]|nr:PucR family transcriptional regulator ligand-binding domain-containing protein [Vallitaleaceae bacterium]
MINCRKLLRITNSFNLKPLAGKSGHNRIISWFHYIENPDYMDWIKGNEMILTTGMFMQGSTQNLLDFINRLFDHEAAGLILNLSPFLHKIPTEAIDLCNFLGFPLFELEAKVRIVDISECICTAIIESASKQNMTEQFLLSLIHERPLIQEKLIRKANSVGFSQDQTYQTLLFQCKHAATSNSPELKLIDLQSTLHKYFEQSYKDSNRMDANELLICIDESNLLFISTFTGEMIAKNSISAFMEIMREKLPQWEITAGISEPWKGLNEFYTSYDQAMQTLRFLPLYTKDMNYFFHRDLDISYRLILNHSPSELRSLYQQVLSGLINSDQSISLDLENTLEMYILENASLNKTAEQLYIHVNTLRYRIKKIEQLLSCNLKSANTLFSLHLALRIKRYMESCSAPEADAI